MSKLSLAIQTVDPPAPAAGKAIIYAKSGGAFVRLASGLIVPLNGITGSTGVADNALLRADGTGGLTAQGSGIALDDSNNITGGGLFNGVAVGGHASRHEDGGADEIQVENMPTTEVPTARRLAPDGLGGVEWVDPASVADVIMESENFLTSNTSSNTIGKLGWRTQGTGTGNAIAANNTVAGHPGVVTIEPGTSAANGRRAVHLGQASALGLKLSNTGLMANELEIEWLIRIRGGITTSDLEMIQLGLADAVSVGNTGLVSDGILVQFDPSADSHFRAVGVASSTPTAQAGTTVVAVDTWYRVSVVFTDIGGSSASLQLKVNGTNEGSPVTTNLPIGTDLIPFAKIDGVGLSGTEPMLDLDRMRLLCLQDEED